MTKTKKSVLVVDDNEEVLELLRAILEDSNYKVFCSSSAEDALELLDYEHINVMYVDIALPGMSGIDFCKKVRQDNPIAFVLAITGYVEKFDVFDCRHFGFDDYFEKPFTPKDITLAAKEAFRKLKRWEHH